MEYSFWGGLMLMVLMADPLGNIPITISCMKSVPNNRRVRVLLRECTIAMGLLLLAMFFGKPFLAAIGLSDAALSIGGSVIVMLMAIRMVFPTKEGVFGDTPGGEPYIVPIAIPAIAGPSTLATIMMLAASQPGRLLEWGAVVVITCAVSFAVLASADWLERHMGSKLTLAFERLTGLLLAMMATQMFLSGLGSYLSSLPRPGL
ncbi:MarC family protein [Sutterella sp.]|uniref:MarC family protein n=1 Tax=Sutterella sp. TaxID=1981025 RepID=UPI0025FAB560|nr:MarC family protein [uncultured Sutterella sp.]